MEWNSTRLSNTRRVWIYRTGATDKKRELPLVVLLDGQYWAEAMPVFSALDNTTQEDVLPPSVYLLIDSLDASLRMRELACDEAFLEAVQEELLPVAAIIAPFTRNPRKTVIAGQSFGGLAALFAGLRSPKRFGCVLAQSGSFWWPGAYAREAARPQPPADVSNSPDVLVHACLLGDDRSAHLRFPMILQQTFLERRTTERHCALYRRRRKSEQSVHTNCTRADSNI